MWGVYFCMGAYKHNVVAVIKIGAFIHGAYFVRVLIISILWYSLITKLDPSHIQTLSTSEK